MFRLANFSDEETDGLYRYLSSTASKVIYNALETWAGSAEKVLDIYMTEFAGPPAGENDTDFFDGISRFISPDVVRPEISAAASRLRSLGGINEDGRIGMELMARKIARMKEKMADPEGYYTFDLFEEFLFAKMLESYVPETYAGRTDPYVITSDEEVAVSAEKLLNEFHVGTELEEELEIELGEGEGAGAGKEYADWLARTIHRIDEMDLWSSEDAGYESLFFWDADYEMAFSEAFVEGIRILVGGLASILGYGYHDIESIFTDIGLKAPLMLVGTQAAFDTASEASRARIAEAMKNAALQEPSGGHLQEYSDMDDELPFS